MSLQQLLLRIVNDPSYTTKGATLTWEELDDNLRLLADAIRELGNMTAGGISAYDPEKEYELGDYASYQNNLWEYIYPTPSTGNAPGVSSSYWAIRSAGALAHQQNTDTHTTSNRFGIGDGNTSLKGIFARGLVGIEPEIRFNNNLGAWEVSIDGVTFIPIGYTGPKEIETESAANNIQLDMSKQFMGVFRGTDMLEEGGDHSLSIVPAPTTHAAMAVFYVQVEAGAVIAFDSYHLFSDARFNAVDREWTALETGWYKMTFTWTGQHWITEISQSVFV